MAPQAVIMATCNAAIDNKVDIMTTLGFFVVSWVSYIMSVVSTSDKCGHLQQDHTVYQNLLSMSWTPAEVDFPPGDCEV